MSRQPKKILYICQYFYPENFRGNDIVFHLAQKGHDVHVITGIPNYPAGKFYDGYGLIKKRHETINTVKVTRLPIIPRGKNKITLILNYISFLFWGCIYILWHTIFHKYDLVFVQQLSPVMMSFPGVLYKKLTKTPLYTWVLDLWPESLTVAGGIKNKYVLTFFDWFVKQEYKWSDKILISSRSFDQSIIKYGNYWDKIIYFPQWSDSDGTLPSDINLPKIPEGFTIMFAGTIGEAQGMECNLNAAMLTMEHKDIKWVIVGDGRKLPWVQNFIKEHGLEETVYTLGHFPSKTMPIFFKHADVLLTSLADSTLYNLYTPAKISSYLASGRPVIACQNGEGAKVVKEARCGWCIPAGDAEALAQLVINLANSDTSFLNSKGASGRIYYETHFNKYKCLQKLDEILNL